MTESDLGKLFIGGISWDTDEKSLKEYFSSYGDVVEAVIMRDRNTGRARGFGFVVFADLAVAERVVKEKHMIDGRTVEAKKAVPKDDQNIMNRNNGNIQGSPGPGRTKKIFVGGLASTITESDFKKYFDQFGTITDVVVMYDHNTQRPRGFGFITYDSEDAVDRSLYKTFHELSGKMVEVKRAVPKERSPGPRQSPMMGYNYGLNRSENFLNSYAQGYNLSSVGGYGFRMDRFNPVASGRTGFSQFVNPAYGMSMNLDSVLSPSFAGGSNFSSTLGYGRVLSPYFGSNSSRYTTPIGYGTNSNRGDSFLSSPTRNVWGNGGLNTSPNAVSSSPFLASGSFGVFGNNGANWGSPVSAPVGRNSSNYAGVGNVGFRVGETSYVLGSDDFGRNNSAGVATSFTVSSGPYEGPYGDLYSSASMSGDPTRQAASPDTDGSVAFAYGLGNSGDANAKDSEGYIRGYNVANRQANREVILFLIWKEALKNAGYLKGHHLQNDYKGYEATCAEKVAADIDARLNQASLAFEENLVGLESRVNNIGNWLRLAYDDNDDFRFIGICGMGGIGKTTIATSVFNKFSHQFDGACFLADVRQHNVVELQKTLLTKILKEKSGVEISNVQEGSGKIRRRLKEKNVLIVLDDVDRVEHLENLAGHPDWFGRGSRVIITTRDAGVLRSHGVDEKYIYPVHTLREEESIQLFRSYAFKKKPKIGVEQLCGLVVHYCKGLPLALKILGSSLCGLEAVDWESTLEELKETPNDDIDAKLKISFDRLDSKNKNIFLHIACFFRHEKEEHVKEALKSCNLLPAMGLRVLIEKSLISVEEGNIEMDDLIQVKERNIEMHDLIQEMGWRIARDEKHSSRVWEFKEVDDVLCGKMDPKHIEFMLFPYTCGFRWQNISNTFEALKILIGKRSRSYNEEGDNNYQLPSSLRWLHFPDYPFSSLPTSFHPSSMDMNPSELVGLCLHRSSLENCWITKELNKLTYLDLSSSGSLLKTPNFDMMPNLRSLDLSHCSKLKEIHPSVGRLEKLVLLDLSHCWQLQTLPCFVQLSSLQFLKLESCSNLENFPEIQANMRLILELNLEGIGIRELPSSIGRLRGLTKLRLCGCNDLVSLSDDLCELESLKILELRECSQLESLPENLGNLSKLEELHLFEIAIFQLPSSITQLSSLECLCWGRNRIYTFQKERSLKFLPSVSGLRSLKKLQLSGFEIIDEGLPSDLGQCLISLEYLNLKESNFDYLPESFSQLPHLQYLDLRDCEELEMLPELPKTIRELYVHSHFAFGKKSINIAMFAIKYPMLYSISFSSSSTLFSWADACGRFRGETFLVKESIQFPFHRKTPFSVNYSNKGVKEHMDDRYPFLRSFQYQRFKSNRICFNLNPYWYSTQFGGFAVYFVSYHDDMWEPHSYEGFDDDCTRHCVIKAKLSSHNDIHEDLKTKCVIAGSNNYKAICFVYVPFSSLWPESKPITEANDYSRFEVELVNLEASTDWGINLLYKRYTFPSLEEGAREHMGNYHRSDSEQSTEEAPLFEETPVSSTQPEPEDENEDEDEEEDKDEDGGSEHTVDNVGYDAMTEDNNPAYHGSLNRSIKNWQKGKVLGSGSFGTVYECITDGGGFFAVKEVSLIDTGNGKDQERIYQLQQEISFLSRFNHENIVRYLGTDKDNSNLYVFLELVSHGSLASLYHKYQLHDTQVSTYTKQILSGLHYLHSRKVIHRDIKCANILVDVNGSVKLADFGLAKVTKSNDIKSMKGTSFWMAPEVVKGESYGCSVDIWSLGCTVLEMLTRKNPYSRFEWMAALCQIFKGELPDIPEDLSEYAKDFIRTCLQVNPSDRPTAFRLLEHPFLMTPSHVPSTSRS